MSKLTYGKIKQLEPEIGELEKELKASIADLSSGGSFCANSIWYRQIKPKLTYLVGWSRGHAEHDQLVDKEVARQSNGTMFMDIVTLLAIDDQTPKPPADELSTSQAYDVVYHRMYAMLPDCRHEGLCW